MIHPNSSSLLASDVLQPQPSKVYTLKINRKDNICKIKFNLDFFPPPAQATLINRQIQAQKSPPYKVIWHFEGLSQKNQTKLLIQYTNCLNIDVNEASHEVHVHIDPTKWEKEQELCLDRKVNKHLHTINQSIFKNEEVLIERYVTWLKRKGVAALVLLTRIIESSKDYPANAIAASNAATIWARGGYPMHGLDLTQAHLPHADLRRLIAVKVNLTAANLKYAVLDTVHWQDVNLTDADLSEASFNQYPYLSMDCKTPTDGFSHREYEFLGKHLETIPPFMNLRFLPLKQEIQTIAFSVDRRYCAIGTHQITLWNLENGLIKQTPAEKKWKWIEELDFSPSENLLVSRDTNNKIRIWSVPELKKIASLKGHGKKEKGLRFLSTGKQIVAVGRSSFLDETRLYFWSLEKKKGTISLFKKNKEIAGIITDLCISPHENVLACAATCQIYILDCERNTVIHKWDYQCFKQSPSLCFSQDGKCLAFAKHDLGKIKIIFQDIREKNIKRKVYQFEQHDVTALQFSKDLSFFAYATEQGLIDIRNMEGKSYNQFYGHSGKVTHLQIYSNPLLLISYGMDRRIRIWSLSFFNQSNSSHYEPSYKIFFSPDSQSLWSLNPTNILQSHVLTGEDLHTYHLPADQEWDDMQLSADQQYVIRYKRPQIYKRSSSYKEVIQIWDIKAKTEICLLDFPQLDQSEPKRQSVQAMHLFTNNQFLATVICVPSPSSTSVLLAIWDVKTKEVVITKVIQTLDEQDQIRLSSYTFSSDNHYFVVSEPQGTTLWQLDLDRKALSPIKNFPHKQSSMQGNFLILDSDEEKLIYDLSLKEGRRFKKTGKIFKKITLSPDGSLFISHGLNGNFYFWDTQAGIELGQVNVPISLKRPVSTTFHFSADGRFLAALCQLKEPTLSNTLLEEQTIEAFLNNISDFGRLFDKYLPKSTQIYVWQLYKQGNALEALLQWRLPTALYCQGSKITNTRLSSQNQTLMKQEGALL